MKYAVCDTLFQARKLAREFEQVLGRPFDVYTRDAHTHTVVDREALEKAEEERKAGLAALGGTRNLAPGSEDHVIPQIGSLDTPSAKRELPAPLAAVVSGLRELKITDVDEEADFAPGIFD